MIEPVDFVDKKDISGLEAGEDGCQITGPFNYRPGGYLNAGPHFVGNNVGKRGLTQTGKSMKKHMIQGFTALQGRLNKNPQALFHLFLADVLIQTARSNFNPRLQFLLLLPTSHQPFAAQIFLVLHCVTTI